MKRSNSYTGMRFALLVFFLLIGAPHSEAGKQNRNPHAKTIEGHFAKSGENNYGHNSRLNPWYIAHNNS